MSKTLQKKESTTVGRLVKGPVGFRRRLERMGPIFVKLGQFLAMRPDVIPQVYCDELMLLLDRMPPFPWDQARKILREDLGAEPSDIFESINHRPIAAGSLAQVHVGRLSSGEEVAVKILRPGIRAKVEGDLKRARLLARLLDLTGTKLIIDPLETVAELSRWMMQEIDFECELSNVTRLYDLAAHSQHEIIPRPYPHLCGPRVLTLEYLRGISVSKVLTTPHGDAGDEVRHIQPFTLNRAQFAENLITACLQQIFCYQFFHADLHPGNLLAMPGNAVGFVDFGLCDRLDETLRKRQMRYLAAVYDGDVEQIYKATADVLDLDQNSDLTGFRCDVLDRTRDWISERGNNHTGKNHNTSVEGERSPVAAWMVGVIEAAHRHKLHVPIRILSMYRALLTVESVARHLSADVDLGVVGRRFFEKLRRQETIKLLETNNVEATMLNTISLWRNSPGQLQLILSDLASGRFSLNVNVTEAASVTRLRNRRTRLLATSILTVSVALLLIAPQMPVLFGIPLKGIMAAVLVLLYLWTFLQWRRIK